MMKEENGKPPERLREAPARGKARQHRDVEYRGAYLCAACIYLEPQTPKGSSVGCLSGGVRDVDDKVGFGVLARMNRMAEMAYAGDCRVGYRKDCEGIKIKKNRRGSNVEWQSHS